MQSVRGSPLPEEELLGAFGVQPTRRSGRVRTQPQVFHAAVSESSDTESEEGDAWGILQGPRHQAAIPALRTRPAAGPTASEAKFLLEPVYSPACEEPQQGTANAAAQQQQQQQLNPGLALPPGQFVAAYRAAGGGDGRRALIAEWVAQMDARLGPVLVQKLGLSLLGAKLRAEWSPQEEILFALGMLEKYRNFRHINRVYLRRRSVHELNGYYYNCWKNNASQVRCNAACQAGVRALWF
ncbi:hypothetical protein COO60DRAFT_975261 [Scenedesmus sp. NREL 46B-D3]|nr:hypothetical protein COO60DRAFT_975261 [Scenedesmus sp. NREL 46B-D3]